MLCHTVPPFKKFPGNIEKCYEALLASAYIGLLGTLALENKNKDFQIHIVLIDRALTVQLKPTVEFVLTNLHDPAQISQWTRSSIFFMKAEGRNLMMEVDDASFVEKVLVIRAKLVTSDAESVKAVYKTRRLRTIVWQEMKNNEHHLELFPSPADYQRMDPRSPVKLLLEACFGGRPIPRQPIPGPRQSIMMGSVVLTSEQSKYVRALTKTNIPVIVANSSFGVGKTTMIAAALHIAIHESPGNKMHLVMTTTNAAAAAITQSYTRISGSVNVIRMISAENYDHIGPQHRTSFDFPIVWPQEFEKLLRRTDSDDQAPITEIVLDAYAHLRSVRSITLKLARRKDLRNALEAVRKPIRTIFEILVQLINPRGIIGTIPSMTNALRENGDMAQYGSHVATVQMDDASQIPIHSIIALGPLCPKARYALIGDINQPKSYTDTDLAEELRTPAVGDLLGDTSKIPCHLNISTVRGCPFAVTATSSTLFYQNRLTSVRDPKERSQILDHLDFPNSHPIQVINTAKCAAHQTSGTSIFNPSEANIALTITSRVLTKKKKPSIGILTYYKAQAGHVARGLSDTPVFIGTIDESQGQEFDLVIILTSRSKSFGSHVRTSDRNETPIGVVWPDPDYIESPERLNVAITQTRSLCLVLVNTHAAGRSELWSKFFCKIPPGAFHNDPSHLMRHLQKLR
ncbi:hypothetical protein CRE_25875 [Caenorhabditis remanei]|uniref:DNA2/NAM7 helicase-like C-terminal domain-containing protein n=1 Tax=Caenorhabditis remanei TaxID=31234 RepID=E3NDS8_CAERE|nr:hypothetical protein CRE_25875 [Caenorhabditis remanei]